MGNYPTAVTFLAKIDKFSTWSGLEVNIHKIGSDMRGLSPAFLSKGFRSGELLKG